MVILHKTKSFKVRHRKANWELKIIVHESTISDILNILPDNLKDDFKSMLSPFVDDLQLEEFLNSDIEKYKSALKNNTFWSRQLLKIPMVKTDGRLKVGEYELNEYLSLKIRNSERYKDQVIELCLNK